MASRIEDYALICDRDPKWSGAVEREFVHHYRAERNHQGIGNELIERPPDRRTYGPVRHRQQVGGILNYYYRSTA